MEIKVISLKSAIFLFLFVLFFVAPHFFQFFNQGIVIPGDYFFYEGNFIESLDSLIIHIKENYLKSLNFIKNPIFIFFVFAAVFQKIIKEI